MTRWAARAYSVDYTNQLRNQLVKGVRKYAGRASLLAALLLLPNYQFYDLEASLFDVQVKARHLLGNWSLPEHPPAIAFVGIDDEAVRTDHSGRLAVMPPLSRSYVADLVRTIQGFKPQVIVLDVLLDRPAEQQADDEALASAIAEAEKNGVAVVLACRLIDARNLRFPLLPVKRYLQDSNVLLGHAYVVASSIDGVLREAQIASPVVQANDLARLDQIGLEDELHYLEIDSADTAAGTFYFWSLAGITLVKTANESTRSRLRTMLASKPFRIDFTVPADQVYATYSSSQIMDGRIRERRLESGIVLIGVNSAESLDRQPTPLSVRSLPVGRTWAVEPVYPQHLSGTEIQAYIMHTLANRLSGNGGIREIPTTPLLFIGCIAGGLVVFTRRKFTPAWWAALVIGVMVGYALLAILFFQISTVYLPILRPEAGFVLVVGAGHSVLARRSRPRRKER